MSRWGCASTALTPDSEIYSPFSENMVSGQFLTADDRSGILIGKRLADSLGLGEGDTVSAAIINSDGQPDEAQFTIRGVYETGVFSYDDSALLMPLAKAQAFANTGGRASAVTMWLTDEEAAEAVAAALARPEVETLTWRTLNEMLLETFETGKGFYVYMYGIVILIVAVLIANTLLMAVFERMREIGILASLGMRRSQITLMFLIEAVILGVFGVILGNILGCGRRSCAGCLRHPRRRHGRGSGQHGHRVQSERRVQPARHALTLGVDDDHHHAGGALSSLVRGATGAGRRVARVVEDGGS